MGASGTLGSVASTKYSQRSLQLCS